MFIAILVHTHSIQTCYLHVAYLLEKLEYCLDIVRKGYKKKKNYVAYIFPYIVAIFELIDIFFIYLWLRALASLIHDADGDVSELVFVAACPVLFHEVVVHHLIH